MFKEIFIMNLFAAYCGHLSKEIISLTTLHSVVVYVKTGFSFTLLIALLADI